MVLAPESGGEIREIRTESGTNLLFYGSWPPQSAANESRTLENCEGRWLSAYRGGWQLLFPNSGAACTVLDTRLPIHGDVTRTRWTWDWVNRKRELRMHTSSRLGLRIERRISLDRTEPLIRIADTVHNPASHAAPFLYANHPAFGPPLTEVGARIDLPDGASVCVDSQHVGELCDLEPGARSQWPNVPSRHGTLSDLSTIPDDRVDRLCYIEMPEAWYAIRNPTNGLGVTMSWNLEHCPVLWFWQDTGSDRFPLNGRARITALEPQSQYPSHGLACAIADGMHHLLPRNATLTTALTFRVFDADERPVTGVTPSGRPLYG